MKPQFLVLVFLLLCSCASQPINRVGNAPPSTVPTVDLQQYLGRWYEIARYPNRFEENCQGVTADYSQGEDGTILVTNTCYEGAPGGEKSVASGRARVVEGTNNSKLKVKFAPAWLPFGEGDYWILGLDQSYDTALVGSPNGKYLWILGRTPQISSSKLAQMKQIAEREGYDTEALEMVVQ